MTKTEPFILKEYWIVNPINKEVSVFALSDGMIADNKGYKLKDIAESYIFQGLTVELEKIFNYQ